MGVFQGHAVISFKHLDDGFILIKLYNTSKLLFFSVNGNFYDFFKRSVLDAFQYHEGAIDFTKS